MRQAQGQRNRAGLWSMAFKDALKEVYRQSIQASRALWRAAGTRALEHVILDLQARPERFGALRSVPSNAGLGLFTVFDTTAVRAATCRLGWMARAQVYAERNVRRRLI